MADNERRAAVRHWVLIGAGAAVALAFVALLIWWVPPALYAYVPDPEKRAGAEASTRTGLIAGLAGLAALGSLTFTARTYRLTEQGQLTDRYTKAIAQLGDDKLDIRLGGIYALERIAVDSQRDHSTIVEVLSAYVRERTALVPLVRPANRRTAFPRNLHRQVKLGVDVQAALTVLGRLPLRKGVSRGDLSRANLTGANLAGGNLAGADLVGADLTGAALYEANLSGAHLFEANLTGAKLQRANLTGANLRDAKLAGARLGRADLTGARLGRADLTGAALGMTNLAGASLIGADLTEAGLSDATLTGAKLGWVIWGEDTRWPKELCDAIKAVSTSKDAPGVSFHIQTSFEVPGSPDRTGRRR